MSRTYKLLRGVQKSQEPSQEFKPATDKKEKPDPTEMLVTTEETRAPLSQTGKDKNIPSLARELPVSADGKRTQLNLDVLEREEEMKLVRHLFFSAGPDGPRMMMFSGVEKASGSSWVCTRAGSTLAKRLVGSVCVVDANLRIPSLHRYFGVENLRGMAEALLESGPIADYAQHLPAQDLWLVTAGFLPTNKDHLLASDRLASRITDLRAAFDYVLVDAPPLIPYGDAHLLGGLVDGLVLVVAANSTRRETLVKARKSLDATNLNLLAAVLSERTFPIPEFLYRLL